MLSNKHTHCVQNQTLYDTFTSLSSVEFEGNPIFRYVPSDRLGIGYVMYIGYSSIVVTQFIAHDQGFPLVLVTGGLVGGMTTCTSSSNCALREDNITPYTTT